MPGEIQHDRDAIASSPETNPDRFTDDEWERNYRVEIEYAAGDGATVLQTRTDSIDITDPDADRIHFIFERDPL